jgi:hypothetical protein
LRFDLIIKLMRFVIVGLFIDLRIFVVDGCFGHVFRSMLLVVLFYRYETLISPTCWVSLLHVLPI